MKAQSSTYISYAMEPLNIEPALLCLKTPEAEVAVQSPKVLQCHPASRSVVDSRILLCLRCSERLGLGLISIFPSCRSAPRVSRSFKEKLN